MSNRNYQYEIRFDRIENRVRKHSREAAAHILIKPPPAQGIFHIDSIAVSTETMKRRSNPGSFSALR
jgi:hypothetical protein